MKKAISQLAVAIFLAASLTAAAESEKKGGHEYLGAEKCKGCHKDIYEQMEKTKMWHALDVLSSDKAKELNKNAATDPKCLKCHVTGLGEGGYDPNLKTEDKKVKEKNEQLAFVGCEACHGPGKDYMKLMGKSMPVGSGKMNKDEALKAGLIIPDAKVCEKCHNEESPFYEKFDFKKFLEKIEHKSKKKD